MYEVDRIRIIIYPLLDALGLEFKSEPILSGHPYRRPDFTITNLPITVIGEAKTPQSYESGKRQLHEYLVHGDAEEMGILTDGVFWQIYVVDAKGDSFSVKSYFEVDLNPVIQEIYESDISNPEELESRNQFEQFLSVFSRPEFKRQIEDMDLFDSTADIQDLAEHLDESSLKLLRTEANEKISNLLEQRRFYQSAGFRLGRTTVVSLSILISLAAILLNQQLNNIGNLLNVYTITGTTLLVVSAVCGTVGPIIIGGLTERTPQRIYRDYFKLAVPDEPAEGITTQKDVLVTLLKQACIVGNTLRDSVNYLLLIVAISLSLQTVGIILILYGIGLV
ncbi:MULTISPECIES: hypothetical protein [Halorussus]|uniref:hypothetical protein n=1 Tax=Halorussus TaxID=1070314 RepID=UPI0020A17EE9|nr:hypothetical protein [Halorussus vallis]USZ77432.1 hypothetical protein NGM07_08890 [Halorussus vallis]